jgi:Glycosyl transferases group 1
MKDEKYQFAYVMDQQVGLKTHALNIARFSQSQTDIHTTFVPVCYAKDAATLARLPFVPEFIRSTMYGAGEIRQGLGKVSYDAVLWGTWAAKSVLECVERSPAYWMMDMTPEQMRDMGVFYGYSRRRAAFMYALKRRSTERLHSTMRHFFPWSTFAADSLIAHYGVPAEKITVTSPGTDISLFKPCPKKPSDGPVRILFVGGDFKRKGGDLLKAWAKDRGNKKNIELHLVTRDYVEPALNIHSYKNIPEMAALYQQADIFVLPTRGDCYSLVAMEAMACGLPVVISDIGGISDIVTDKETGFLIPPGDGETMGKYLDLLISDSNLRQEMGYRSYEKAITQFCSKKNIESVIEKMRDA